VTAVVPTTALSDGCGQHNVTYPDRGLVAITGVPCKTKRLH